MEWYGKALRCKPTGGTDMVIDNSPEFLKKVERQISRTNQYVGELFVSNARQTNTYKDETGNLRNSIGYLAITKGDTASMSFGQGGGGGEGQQYAMDLKSEVRDSGLIMVAGMGYGAAVEARGYDVITNSVHKAKNKHRQMITKALKV